jgi:hypothetical protein
MRSQYLHLAFAAWHQVIDHLCNFCIQIARILNINDTPLSCNLAFFIFYFEAADTSAAGPVSSENGAGVADTVARAGAVAPPLIADAPGPLPAGSSIICAEAMLATDRDNMSGEPLSASRPQCSGPFTGTTAAAGCLSASRPAVDAHAMCLP